MRFLNYNGNWSKDKFSDLVSIHARIGWQGLRQSEFLNDGDIYLITGTDFENGKINFDKCKYIGYDRFIQDEHIQIQNNDILITKDGSIGKIAIVKNITKKATLNAGVYRVRPKTNAISSDYLFQYLNGNRLIDYANRQMTGGTIKHLNQSSIVNMPIFYPSLKEQKKISFLLNLIDSKIETQNKIIVHYESLIKGIRDKVFTHVEGKTIKLKDVLDEYSQKNVKNSLIPVSVGKYGIRFRNEIYKKELSGNLSTNKIIFKNTLIIGMGSTQIDIGFLMDDVMYCVSPAYTTYVIHGIDSLYLDEYLKKINSLLSKKYMIIGARQGKSVNKKELMNHEIIIHSQKIQLTIAGMFKLLQQKLDKEKRMLQLLNSQKTFLLSNMFI